MTVILLKYFCFFLAVVNDIAPEAEAGSEKAEVYPSHRTSEIDSHKPCEADWEEYKNEKCLRLLNYSPVKQLNYADAKAYCMKTFEADLVSIGSQEKQSFLERYLRLNEVSLNVWIGLEHKMNAIYEWSDGTQSAYKNWATGSPNNRSGNCVQMQVDKEKFGNWSDILCTTKNLVMCEKVQLWTPLVLQETVMNMLSTQIFPVGFIFFQLPSQKPPTEIWPSITWKDVSADYAGVFFRVLGWYSDSFGSIQSDEAPRLTEVKTSRHSEWNGDDGVTLVYPPEGSWSEPIFSGTRMKIEGSKTAYARTLTFSHSSGEVRPLNMAIRVWKRF